MTASSFVILNEALTPADDAALAVNDRGFLFGDGLFETMRVTSGTVPLLARHYDRLSHGCRVLRLPTPSMVHLRQHISALLQANHLTEGSVRLSISRGGGPRGLAPPPSTRPTLLLTAAPTTQTLPQPARLQISTQHRRDERSILCRVKSLNALPAILARIEAQEHGATDALMLNYRGTIAEATAATFLARQNGELITPPLSDGALPGISRARLLDGGLCREKSLTPENLPSLEGAWLLTALSLTPITSINRHVLPMLQGTTRQLRHTLYGH